MDMIMQSVSKKFGGKQALSSVSLTVKSGEIVCLLGPSGAGKTTLIRLFMGAIRPNEGSIFIGGAAVPDRELLRKIGYMPQQDALYLDISAADNLAFFGELYGLRGAQLKNRIEELLVLLDLAQDKNRPVSQFSGGMKKRLSLAVALLHRPSCLLLDEPTVGIDPVLRKAIWDRFYSLRQSGVTLLISTHVMDEAKKCDRAALISNGKLIFDDSIQSLLARTQHNDLEELFFMPLRGEADV